MTQQSPLTRRQVIAGGASLLGAIGLGELTRFGTAAAGQPPFGRHPTAPRVMTPKQGGALRFGYLFGSSSDTLDVQFAQNDFEIGAGLQLHSTLLRIRDGEQVMTLAEEIDLESPTSVVIRLKQGLEFHNAKTITASDVLASYARILNPDNPGMAAGRLANIDLESSEILDELTLRLALSTPDVFVIESLATSAAAIYPDGEWDEAARVGAGPFKVVDFVPGSSVEYERFDNYWGDGPYVDTLTFLNFTDPTAQVNALTSGAIDIAGDLPAVQARTLGGGMQIVQGTSGGFSPFVMRCDVPPFDDVRVRQALRLLVNREEMLTQLQDGLGSIGNDLYSPFDSAFAGDGIPQREQDVEQAKALLAEAGAEGLEFSMAVSGLLPNAEVVLAEQARAAGVTINIEQVDQTTYYDQHYAQDPLFVSFWPALPYALQTRMAIVPGADYPEGNWDNEQFNQLFIDASADVDEASRNDKLAEMQRLFHEEGPYLIWGFQEQTDAMAPNVRGNVQDSSGYPFGLFEFTTMYFE